MQPRRHKAASFLSAPPVFTRAEFAAAFGHPATAANVTSLLRHHLRAGNIKRVSRGVFAAVPAHLAVERLVIDRFAAASMLRPDGVLGFHSALELHGAAYSEFNEVQLISTGRTELVNLPFGACLSVTPSKALAAAGKADYLTATIDRQGVAVRVTAVERTVVDVLHRPELAGGVDEVLQSLDLDAISILRRSQIMSSCWKTGRLPPFPADGSRSDVRRSASPTTSWGACRPGFHGRSTTRSAPNLVRLCSSSRGACFCRGRLSTLLLRACDGRVARNASAHSCRTAASGCDAGAVIRLIDILDAFGADTLIGPQIALKGGTALNVFHSDLAASRSISTSTMSTRSTRSKWTRTGRDWKTGSSG